MLYRTVCLLFVLTLAVPAWAHAGTEGAEGGSDAVEKLLSRSLSKPKARTTNTDRRLKELTGRFPLPKAGSVEESLLSFIEEHREAFGLADPRAELSVRDSQSAYGMSRVTFQQMQGDLPVYDKTIEMDVSPDGELVLVVSRVGPVKAVANVEPAVSRRAAYDAVRAEWAEHREGPMPPAGIETVIYNDALAHKVVLVQEDTSWSFLVDATDGRIVRAKKSEKPKEGHCPGM